MDHVGMHHDWKKDHKEGAEFAKKEIDLGAVVRDSGNARAININLIEDNFALILVLLIVIFSSDDDKKGYAKDFVPVLHSLLEKKMNGHKELVEALKVLKQ